MKTLFCLASLLVVSLVTAPASACDDFSRGRSRSGFDSFERGGSFGGFGQSRGIREERVLVEEFVPVCRTERRVIEDSRRIEEFDVPGGCGSGRSFGGFDRSRDFERERSFEREREFERGSFRERDSRFGPPQPTTFGGGGGGLFGGLSGGGGGGLGGLLGGR